MLRRRKLLLLAGLALGVLMAAMAFIFRYDLAGWARGEAKYGGRYTCEWRAELSQIELVLIDYDNGGETRLYVPPPSFLDRFLNWSFGFTRDLTDEPNLLAGDPSGVPVLVELLRDWEPKVRALAAEGLGKVGPEASVAIGRLRETVEDDPDLKVKGEAKKALSRIDPVNYSHFGP